MNNNCNLSNDFTLFKQQKSKEHNKNANANYLHLKSIEK